MKTRLFDYNLPTSRIAQKSVRPRDRSRLMVVDPVTQKIVHRRFFEIGEYLKPGDLLVVNDTKVFKARLQASVERSGRTSKVEIFLLNPVREQTRSSDWACLVRPGKKVQQGAVLEFKGFSATAQEKKSDGIVIIRFPKAMSSVIRFANQHGSVPIPPYVKKTSTALSAYQTVYAKKTGSVAAPTAGFHFTKQLIKKLKKNGVCFANVTLHVGVGTFRPITADTLEDHVMHAEWGSVPAATRRLIQQTRKNKGRVIAVGTTTVRALEGLGRKKIGWIDLFISPGYEFKMIDAIITNFHLPRSTLLALVSAFAGREFLMRAYKTAVRKKYRFYSFGDAMFVMRKKKTEEVVFGPFYPRG